MFRNLIGILLLITGLFLKGCSHKADIPPKNILVIHSYEERISFYSKQNNLLKQTLAKEGINADVRFVYLDCEAYQMSEEIEYMKFLVETKTQAWKPDIILVNDDQATYTLLQTHLPIVEEIPIVFAGVVFPNYAQLSEYSNITGLHDQLAITENLQLMKDLFDGALKPFTILDSNYLDKKVYAEIERLGDLAEEISIYPSQFHFRSSCEALNGMREREFGKSYIQLKRDLSTDRIGLTNVNPSLTAINEGFDCSEMLLGGYFTPIDIQIKEQVALVKRIFRGESPGNIPIQKSGKSYQIDWNVWKAIGMEDEEPPSYVKFINRPMHLESPIEFYGIISLMAILLFLLLLALVMRIRREKRKKERAQHKLLAEKEMLALSIRGSNTYAWYITEGYITIDKTFWNLMGVSKNKIELFDFLEYIHPDFREYARKALTGLSTSTQVLQIKCQFGSSGYEWWEFRYTTIENTKSLDIQGLLRNIEEEKNREEEMRIAREKAEKAELKQSFLTNISHEIRTPLNAIVGFVNILNSGEELMEEERKLCVETINLNTEHLLGLVNDVLDLSRMESGQMEVHFTPCAIQGLIEETYQTYKILIPDGIEFKVENITLDAYVKVDEGRMKQVLNNFITNAIKFTESGYIKLGCRLNESTQEAIFFVEDSGKGIAKDEQLMVFTRFYKENEFAQGTGLGLSICKVIVEKLNGKIELHSEVGKGSCFSVRLPYYI